MPRVDGGDDLLANLGWVRRLALAIVRDAGAADDVAQEVARVALERRAAVPASGLRAWLGAVTRRLALDRTRADAARRTRERSVARPEGDGSEAEIVERSANQQRVAHAVMSLPEPYRSTILYRYLDELPMSEVARRTGVNEAAARKRLSRGLEMLRARLDVEFGTNTRGWALALLAPGKGALIMSTKWIAAGAAAVILGLGWWGWHAAHAPTLASADKAIAVEPNLEAPPVVAEAPAPPVQRLEIPAIVNAPRVTATQPAPDPDATILHVRLLDRAGSAVTSGRVECAWSGSMNAPTADNRRFVEADIHSAITDIVLPPSAVEAFVRASTSGHLGTKELPVKKLRQETTGRVERDVELTLDEPLETPALRGFVTVDGTPRLPHAFMVSYSKQGQGGSVGRVNAVDASYAIAKVAAGGALLVTSDETVPMTIELSADNVGSGVLDIQLSSGRTLLLTLLDHDDGHPLAGEDFIVETSLRLSNDSSASGTRTHRTDSNGKCEIHGLCKNAFVSVRPGLEATRRPMIFSDDWGEQHLGKFTPTENLPIAAQAWWKKRLTGDEPTLEVTLRVKPASEGAVIFGTLPKEMLAGQADVLTRIRVTADEIDEKNAKNGYRFDVPVDAEGQWSFPVHWPSRYVVWIEAVKSLAVLSPEVQVDVTSAGRRGPIGLRPLESAPDFELRVDNVPAGGRLEVSVFAEKQPTRHEIIDCKAASCVHRLRLDCACSLTLLWSPSGDMETQVRRTFKVDPTRQKSLRADMGGDNLRAIEISLHGAAMPSSMVLGFGKLSSSGQFGGESTSTSVHDGRAQGKVCLSPGRWYFECFERQDKFYVTGVIEVAAGSDTIRIAREVVVLQHADAPRGIELTELDGVKLDLLERPIRIPWDSSEGSVVLNATTRWTSIP